MKRSPYAVREVAALCAVLAVGLMLLARLADVVAPSSNDADAPGEEEGAAVWLCSSVRGSWSERWPDLVHYDA